MRRHRLRTALIIAALLAGGLPLLDWLTRQPPAHAGPRWHVRRLAPRRWEIAFASAYDGRETEERIFLLAFQRSLWGETSVTIEQTLTRDRSGDTF